MKNSYNVLFICTGNSARSMIAEALPYTFGQGRFKAFHKSLILLERKIDLLTMLPIEKIDALALKNRLNDIGASK